jgi:predicted transcriptional regulator
MKNPDPDWAIKVLSGGHNYDTEKMRIAFEVADMTLEEMQEFARSYDKWAERCFPGIKIEKKSVHGERGDIVCEVGTTTPLVFIGSVRKSKDSSTRLVIDSKKRSLKTVMNIRQTKREFMAVLSDSAGNRFITAGMFETQEEFREEIINRGYEPERVTTRGTFYSKMREGTEGLTWMKWT